MSLPAHFDEPVGRERRSSDRRALRLDVEGPEETGDPAQVTVHDLSRTGMLIETSTSLAQGETIEVDLPESGKVEARIVWNSGRFYGCQFSTPISNATLSAALLLSSPPSQAPATALAPNLAADLRAITEQVERIASEVERAVGRLSDKDRK
jgi:hypothetical protein